jgi:hypothetical protein
MLGKSRRRPDRKPRARKLNVRMPERLEDRNLLSSDGPFHPYAVQHTTKLPRTVDFSSPKIKLAHPYGSNPHVLAKLQGEGKCITGKDRDGDEWMITVHGPGIAIVTDASPGDGVFDDDIDTITIYGSDPNRTYVYAQTNASARVISDGIVRFNRLIAINGAHSIILNGFTLAQTVEAPYPDQPNNVGPEIYIPGGTRLLSFHNIEGLFDLAGNGNGSDQPFEIVIGQENTPLKFRPSVVIDSIFNTVFDSTEVSMEGLGPQLEPSVNFIINGEIQVFEAISITATPIAGGLQFNFPTVDVTGRTALRGLAVKRLKVTGAARNFTASRAGAALQPQTGEPGIPERVAPTTQPFSSPFSGMRYIKKASFGGNADAVGLDVSGPIGDLTFARGLGDPTGVPLNATQWGFNSAQAGYPSRGLLGGLVVARSIGKLRVAPANLTFAMPTDPDLMQLYRQGSTTLYARPGSALTNAAIVTQESMNEVTIVGNSKSSQVNSGFDYNSYIAGLDPTRSPSHIRKFRQKGDLIDSVVAASYRPTDGVYGNDDDQPQRGSIEGNLRGRLYDVGTQTALGYRGVGIYARNKVGYLPPPERRQRNHLGVLRP